MDPRKNPAERDSEAAFAPEDDFTANWTRAQALEIEPDATNTKPLIPEDFPIMTDEVWIWDTWPLTDLDMKPIQHKGWNVIFSLTAPRDIAFGDRHWVAKIGYFFSRDGQNWTYGGDLHPAGSALGCREWAGSTLLLRGNQLHNFYTASGDETGSCPDTDALQRLAHTVGKIKATEEGVSFEGFKKHEIIAEAEGELYQTLEQSEVGPIIYAFRDPFVFRDPADGEVYALFEGNNPGVAGTHTCDPEEIGDVPPGHEVPAEPRFYTGNIGLMKAKNGRLSKWELLPPVLSAECTNQQTERPHLVVHDGKYYLWTISHEFTFAPGVTGPDGLYGFVGDGVRSDYQALNGSALVLGNPEEAPLQNYSDYVMPNLLVESFIDTVPTADGGVRFGGTLAPTLELDLNDESSTFVREHGYGYIPAMRFIR
jgi:levansucrase